MKIDIKHLAKLANLPLPENELKKLEGQIESTLDHVKRLSDIDTSKVEGTSEVTGLTNVTRKDEIKPSLSQDEALSNAKRKYNGFFVVPVIIEDAIEK